MPAKCILTPVQGDKIVNIETDKIVTEVYCRAKPKGSNCLPFKYAVAVYMYVHN